MNLEKLNFEGMQQIDGALEYITSFNWEDEIEDEYTRECFDNVLAFINRLNVYAEENELFY